MQTLILDGNPLGGLDKDAFKSADLLNLQKISLKGCDIRYEINISPITLCFILGHNQKPNYQHVFAEIIII